MSVLETSLEEVVPAPKSKSLLSAIGGPQFLAAQLFTILATIAGVYLAGYVGFQRNLEYDRYGKAQQRSGLITAIHGELKENISSVRTFNEELFARVNKGSAVHAGEWQQLSLFAWEAAGGSPSAFDIPPETLTKLQVFYRDLNSLLHNSNIQSHYSVIDGRGNSSKVWQEYHQKLSAYLEFAEVSILPALDKAIKDSNRLVQKYSGSGDAPN
jgi:hypothetical protein